MEFKTSIENYFKGLHKAIDKVQTEEIEKVIQKLVEVYERNGDVYIFGNGGSASTASHFVNDFNKGLCKNTSKKFKLHCLNDNVSSVLAIANDISFNDIFKEQLKNFLKKEDVVIAISGSGNSKNVIAAIEYANAIGAETIGLVGYDGGAIRKIAKNCIHVPVNDMQKVEDVHLMLNHLISSALNQYIESN